MMDNLLGYCEKGCKKRYNISEIINKNDLNLCNDCHNELYNTDIDYITSREKLIHFLKKFEGCFSLSYLLEFILKKDEIISEYVNKNIKNLIKNYQDLDITTIYEEISEEINDGCFYNEMFYIIKKIPNLFIKSKKSNTSININFNFEYLLSKNDYIEKFSEILIFFRKFDKNVDENVIFVLIEKYQNNEKFKDLIKNSIKILKIDEDVFNKQFISSYCSLIEDYNYSNINECKYIIDKIVKLFEICKYFSKKLFFNNLIELSNISIYDMIIKKVHKFSNIDDFLVNIARDCIYNNWYKKAYYISLEKLVHNYNMNPKFYESCYCYLDEYKGASGTITLTTTEGDEGRWEFYKNEGKIFINFDT